MSINAIQEWLQIMLGPSVDSALLGSRAPWSMAPCRNTQGDEEDRCDA
jgi:hypothetical protein